MKILIDDVLREQHRTRYNLSILANVNYMSIKKLCDGDTKNLSINTLDKISTALQVPINRLIECEEHAPTLRRLNDEMIVEHQNITTEVEDTLLEVALTGNVLNSDRGRHESNMICYSNRASSKFSKEVLKAVNQIVEGQIRQSVDLLREELLRFAENSNCSNEDMMHNLTLVQNELNKEE